MKRHGKQTQSEDRDPVLERLEDCLRAGPLPEPPPELVERTRRAIHALAPETPSAWQQTQELFGQFAARLRTALTPPPGLLALQGVPVQGGTRDPSSAGQTSALLVSVQERHLLGQLLLASEEEPIVGRSIELRTEDGQVLETVTTDGLGRFAFPDVAPGTYQVRLADTAGLEGGEPLVRTVKVG
jgi:AcrR family transcriptional regulator